MPAPSDARLVGLHDGAAAVPPDGNGRAAAGVGSARLAGRPPLAALFGTEHEAYRASLRSVVQAWRSEAVAWEHDGELPAEPLRALGRAGAFRHRWVGGATAGLPYAIVMAEELCAISSGLALAAMTHSEVFLAALARLARGPAQLAVRARALQGDAIGAFAATEPGTGTDLQAIETMAVPDGGGWRLAGRKRYVSNLNAATHVLVLATVEGSSNAGAGSAVRTALFLVAVDAPGVEVSGYYAKAGTRSCATGELGLDCRLGPDALLGAPGSGLAYVSWLLQLERASISAQMLASCHMSLGLAVAYARQRRVGAGPLIQKQVIRHRIAQAGMRLWAAEAFFHSVVAAAMAGADVNHEMVAAKVLCAETAGRIADESLQIFGGRGYTTNFPIERCWRDVRAARIGGGSDEVLFELIASALDRPDPRFEAWLDELMLVDGPTDSPYSRRALI